MKQRKSAHAHCIHLSESISNMAYIMERESHTNSFGEKNIREFCVFSLIFSVSYFGQLFIVHFHFTNYSIERPHQNDMHDVR